MLTNIVRAFCLAIDVGFVVVISVAGTRRVARWHRRRWLAVRAHEPLRIVRPAAVSPERPVR